MHITDLTKETDGFGFGVYGGDPSDLTAMSLSPMNGYNDPSSKNYGNYIHSNGSAMVFIPAFCYRVGNPASPSYTCDKENALEIRDAALGEGDGFVLHRAFIDGGERKLGFFIDKSYIPNCHGRIYDAITLGRSRGEQYSCLTAFQWSAISMLSYVGINCGITVVNTAWWQPLIGCRNPYHKVIHILKESVRAHDFTKDNRNDASLYDVVSISKCDGTYRWGSDAFRTGTNRALCGVLPNTYHSDGNSRFGRDFITLNCYEDGVLLVRGGYTGVDDYGVWYRFFDTSWTLSDTFCGFRTSGYAS